MTVNKYASGLPEKPTAHQAGGPYNNDNFIIISYNKWNGDRREAAEANTLQ